MRSARTGTGGRVRTGQDPARAGVLVECLGVSRVFGRGAGARAAVRTVNCAVHAGMRIALVGPSGSGKSTLLHVLAGLETPTTGSVRWPGLGGPPHGRPGTAGVVFQGPSLVPALDMVENVALPLLLAGVGEDEAMQWAGLALDRLRIPAFRHHLPDEVSGGQAQRVAVARAMAGRPRLILADEPTGRLDRDIGHQVLSVLLDAVGELGAALVVATHDPEVTRQLPERWLMSDGRLTATEGS